MMKSTESDHVEPTRSMRAEAAAWLARLHRPHRVPEDEAGFRRWLQKDPRHKRAWELANEMWMVAQRLPLTALSDAQRRRRQAYGPGAWKIAAALLCAVLLTSPPTDILRTGVGELRIVALEDGSRVSLNTETQLHVRFTEDRRRVRLLSGEAIFDVRPNKSRPFIVTAGEKTITALGTSFLVRMDRDQLVVALVEGRISVANITPTIDTPVIDMLEPGDRVIYEPASTPTPERVVGSTDQPHTEDQGPVRDRPRLEDVTAWQRGVAVFDDTGLIDAAKEMNRYNPSVQLHVDLSDVRVSTLRVSGVFKLGDSESFAKAVAHSYALTLHTNKGIISISADDSSQASVP